MEDYAIVIGIEFLPSAKNLARCQQNLGLGRTEAALAVEQKYVLFQELDEGATHIPRVGPVAGPIAFDLPWNRSDLLKAI